MWLFIREAFLIAYLEFGQPVGMQQKENGKTSNLIMKSGSIKSAKIKNLLMFQKKEPQII